MAPHMLSVAATTGPSWYWYATRGLGIAALIVLTVTVVLGILSAVRWTGESTPGFVAAQLHRNLSLLAICLVVVHVVTTVLDPFAHIGVPDVIIPVGARYRPVWLGLGVVAAEVMIALAATSLLRDRIGVRTWRLIHWTAYACWPLALVHGLGTGSDQRAPWFVGVVAACLAAVLLALIQRLRRGALITLPFRVAAAVAVAVSLVIGAGWAFNGPFQAGWAAKAGTPSVAALTKRPGPVHPAPGGFSDPLAGVVVRDSAGGTRISMRDQVDTGITIAIRSPNSEETFPVVTIARDGRVLCTEPASPGDTLYAVCGTTRLTIAFAGPPSVLQAGGQITGQLITSGPLN